MLRTSLEYPSELSRTSLAGSQSAHPLIGYTLDELECELVIVTLNYCGGNRTRSARVLGISIRTLRNKIREYAARGVAVPKHSH